MRNPVAFRRAKAYIKNSTGLRLPPVFRPGAAFAAAHCACAARPFRFSLEVNAVSECPDQPGCFSQAYLDLLPAAAGYFCWSEDGCRPLCANAALTALLGRSADALAALLETGEYPFLSAEDGRKFSLAVYKARVSGGAFRETMLLGLPDGSQRWMEVRLNAEPQVGGSCRMCFLLSDMTARMESQQKLDSTYSRLVDVMDNTPGGIAVFSTVNNRISEVSYASHGMDRLLRGSREAIAAAYKEAPYRCVHPEDRPRLIHIMEDALRNLSGFQLDLRLKSIPGDYFWVSASATIDATDNQRVVYMAFMDISADAENLHLQKQILQIFVRRQYEHICCIDGRRGSYQVISANGSTGPFLPEQGENFEQDFAALIRRAVVPEEQAQLLQEFTLRSVLALLERAGDADFYCTVASGGAVRYKRLWLSWVDRETRMIAFVSSDVTDEHDRSEKQRGALFSALQAAEEANAAKSEFLSRMSHDIRTPLNAIIGYTEMCLEDEALSPQIRDYLSKADASSRFLLSLINDILNMSRIESGKLALAEEPFALAPFLDGISAIVSSSCAAKQIRYSCRTQGPVHPLYIGDALKLQQVILNLVGNAVKFTADGGEIVLTVREQPAGDPRQLCFLVQDTGCGISPEFLPHLFDPFSQERRTLDSEIHGTGLGLAICKGIVSRMGGTIRVESQLGAGSVFSVELPLRTAPAPAAPDAPPPCPAVPGPVPDFGGRRVLLAEDNALNTEIALHMLEKANLRVDAVPNGAEACRLFAASPENSYSVILMDIRMPVMDGLEATAQIRSLARADSWLPIIAMSANAFEEDIRDALAHGMTAYTIKPIDAAQLYAALRRFIR